MDFKKSIEYLNKKGVTAYEISKNTDLNESGIKRVLDGEVESPRRKTKEAIVNYAKILQEKDINQPSQNKPTFIGKNNQLEVSEFVDIFFLYEEKIMKEERFYKFIQLKEKNAIIKYQHELLTKAQAKELKKE